MNKIKLLNNSVKLCQNAFLKRNALNSLSALNNRNISLTSTNNKHSLVPRWPTDDSLTGFTSNFIRNIDKEFDQIRRRMERTFGNLLSFELPSLGQSDFIQEDKDGNRKFHLAFDMRNYDPENIKIKTKGNNLIVSAKKENKSDNDYYLREFTQSFKLPDELKVDDLKSKFTDDGLLIVEAPMPKLVTEIKNKPKEILIERESSQSVQNEPTAHGTQSSSDEAKK